MPGAPSVAANPPRLVGWGSEPGVARASDALCRAVDRLAQELHSRARPPSPVFRRASSSSVPGPVPPPAGLGQNVGRGPRAPLVGLPSGLSTGPGCARSLCSSGAHPSHPCHGQDPSRRRPPAGALLSARPPDRWAPRGARQSRRTRCISPTCAKIDLPHEHPI